MSRKLILGDIHGSYLALKQVLERSNFDYENDLLITIGDIVDGWGDSYKVVEELLKIKNRIDIIGNHDSWFRKFIETGIHESQWRQGALATAKSYADAIGLGLKVQTINATGFINDDGYLLNLNSGDITISHQNFFKHQHYYYKDEDNNVFIHGGFNRQIELNLTPKYIMMWDRHLWGQALSAKSTKTELKYIEDFNQIFIGHTSTTFWGSDKPMKAGKIWNLDTGAGGDGKLSIMDVNTNEYWQSDDVVSLYPDDPHNLKFK